jgi:hypothetical protein
MRAVEAGVDFDGVEDAAVVFKLVYALAPRLKIKRAVPALRRRSGIRIARGADVNKAVTACVR